MARSEPTGGHDLPDLHLVLEPSGDSTVVGEDGGAVAVRVGVDQVEGRVVRVHPEHAQDGPEIQWVIRSTMMVAPHSACRRRSWAAAARRMTLRQRGARTDRAYPPTVQNGPAGGTVPSAERTRLRIGASDDGRDVRRPCPQLGEGPVWDGRTAVVRHHRVGRDPGVLRASGWLLRRQRGGHRDRPEGTSAPVVGV